MARRRRLRFVLGNAVHFKTRFGREVASIHTVGLENEICILRTVSGGDALLEEIALEIAGKP